MSRARATISGLGIYDWRSGKRLPVTIDGEPVGDSYRINEGLTMFAADPDSE